MTFTCSLDPPFLLVVQLCGLALHESRTLDLYYYAGLWTGSGSLTVRSKQLEEGAGLVSLNWFGEHCKSRTSVKWTFGHAYTADE